ncbi:DcrB-related protein [Anabaena cylindrica FACHB-243]|uniref:DUF1795 domain-containing protein n=2 Tax=Nostocaceae TaxID=1162 RepID=K9Z9F6_ANACC|nr:hypothetical protein Anacy_0189 [Anabaena cylindrica PCC 7122]MBD2420200.1 DcrB-related protein [Anabaena cylindrica FACHB-243]MBY5283071.1 DcrB-related protein [Anabaena sp. CCAP 1446/1C]MBY5311584.1 DcrB-related protein [Anabaena sp. CCAP 1446/1C]MCM2406147.1 DcrB-related protein [Anabaena sp. CCAP 1446/1C]
MAELPPMATYSHEEIGISISVPENWSGEIISELQFRIFGEPETGFEEYFDEYRSTMSYTLAEPDNTNSGWFETLIKESVEEMAQDYNEFQLIKEEQFQIANHPAYVRYYEWTEENTGLRLSQVQSLIKLDDSAFYLINAATLKPLAEKYLPIFNAILQSTQITR